VSAVADGDRGRRRVVAVADDAAEAGDARLAAPGSSGGETGEASAGGTPRDRALPRSRVEGARPFGPGAVHRGRDRPVAYARTTWGTPRRRSPPEHRSRQLACEGVLTDGRDRGGGKRSFGIPVEGSLYDTMAPRGKTTGRQPVRSHIQTNRPPWVVTSGCATKTRVPETGESVSGTLSRFDDVSARNSTRLVRVGPRSHHRGLRQGPRRIISRTSPEQWTASWCLDLFTRVPSPTRAQGAPADIAAGVLDGRTRQG